MPREKRASTFDPETGESRPVRKREKYTRIACETCKARKVKCSGQLPCSRCIEMRAECRYHEFPPPPLSEAVSDNSAVPGQSVKRRRTSTLSNPELGQLLLTMKKVCEDIESSASNYDLDSIPTSSLKRSQRHVVSGHPTIIKPNPDYIHSLNLARDVLERKGILESPPNRVTARKQPPSDGPNVTTPAADTLRAAKPILHIGHEKALQYLGTFKDHIYPAYPCISLSVAAERMAALFKASTPPRQSQDIGLDLIDVEVMKATFAIAMIMRGENDHPLCRDLMAHLLWNVDTNMNEERAQVEDIIMATLLNQPLKSWRMIGLAARASLELGLHRERSFQGLNHPSSTVNFHKVIFSCVYDLDKRCSFFANLPWALHEKDIDVDILALGDRHPYLSAMLALNRVHAEIIRFNAAAPATGGKETDEQTEIFDYRVQKLVENIRGKGLFSTQAAVLPSTEVQNVMSSILQLRANNVRILAYTRYLSPSDASPHKTQPLHQLISLAMASVDVCLGMSSASALWRPLIDRLLMASVSCMFLAVSQNSAKYGPLCRKAFHTAIDALNLSSYKFTESESEVWCSLDDLRRLGRKIQMPPLDEPPATETTPNNCFTGSTILDGELAFSAEELAQLCEPANQDTLPGLWDSGSLWENTFNDFELV
ncbi:hypothetical protein FDECE_3334 [Fusarium decemcellulare]|nr:hypothetical protein FDECE_3334 [Fusarium decemcellulare]